jgi:hypothetical protein
VPRTDPICPQGRLAEDLLLEIFEHIIPGALFTEDECRKMYTALAGTSSFFASIVTPRRFRHVTSIPSGRRPDRAPVWISLVGTGDHAALAVAQQVMSMEVEEMDTDPRLALFVAWLSMPRLSTLVLRQWVISRETLDALSHLDNLESLSLLRCTLERSAIPHIRPLRIQKLFLETYSRAEPLAHEERGLASLADAAVLRVLRAPASSLPTRFFPGCVFPVLETACIDLFDHSSADLQQAVCAFLTKTIALEKLQLSGFFGNASEFRLPLSALAHLTHLKAPAHVLSPLAVGRSIRMLDLTTSESASVPLTEGLASLRLPEIREVLARVEHLKIFDNLLLGGNVLPCAACLETLRVEVEHHNYQIHRVRVQGYPVHVTSTEPDILLRSSASSSLGSPGQVRRFAPSQSICLAPILTSGFSSPSSTAMCFSVRRVRLRCPISRSAASFDGSLSAWERLQTRWSRTLESGDRVWSTRARSQK